MTVLLSPALLSLSEQLHVHAVIAVQSNIKIQLTRYRKIYIKTGSFCTQN